MRLLLIRHAQSVGNAAHRIQGWDDQPLTEVGKAQAEALAARIACESPLQALYASPLLRARQTADIIAERIDMVVQCDDRLKEHDCGAITGMCFDEVESQYPALVAAWRESPWRVPLPGEESLEAFEKRVMSAMADVVGGGRAEDVIAVVSHGGTLGTYLTGLLGLDRRKRHPWMFDNASLSVVVKGGARPRIALLNDTCHLNRRP